MTKKYTNEERIKQFWTKSVIKDLFSCWEWIGATGEKGYGIMKWDGRLQVASRIAWQIVRGIIPDGLCVCHRCDNPPCVRPSHLFLGTQSDNINDMVSKKRNNDPKGEDHGRSKLTNKDVFKIRKLWKTRLFYQTTLAKKYQVHVVTINRICNRRNWKHI